MKVAVALAFIRAEVFCCATETVLATACVQGALRAGRLGEFPALSDGLAVGYAVVSAVFWSIPTISRTTTASSVGTWLALPTGVAVALHKLASIGWRLSMDVHVHEHAVVLESVVQMMMGIVDRSMFSSLMTEGKDRKVKNDARQ